MKAKICGITNLEDAELAVELGAWALGFVFYPKSPRYLSPSRARDIIQKIGGNVRTVGVFVNPTSDEVNSVIQEAGIHTVQLHGEETPEDCAAVGVPVFKALRLQNEEDLDRIRHYARVESVLIDAAVSGQWGGTGELCNWKLASLAKSYHRVILSGGLTAENVYQAISSVNPAAVDVSSGVEEYPGKKSSKKLREFFRSLHAAHDVTHDATHSVSTTLESVAKEILK